MTEDDFIQSVNNGFIPPVQVVATEMVIYQLRLQIGEQLHWLTDRKGPLTFTSAAAACRWLWDKGVRRATLVTDGYPDAEAGGGSDSGLSHALVFQQRP